MKRKSRSSRYAACFTLFLFTLQLAAQRIVPISAFPLHEERPAIHATIQAGHPFTVAGESGVVLGQQEGTFEAWLLPVKLLSHFVIRTEVAGYSVPIEVNPTAAHIDVYPDHTAITYSHIAFTIREIIFSPNSPPQGTGPVVLFQFDSVRPMDITFSFTPELRRMWPEPNEGVPSPEWVKRGSEGMYILHEDLPGLAAAVAMPHAQPGILAPYQEKPQTHPLELKLHYDPKIDGDRYFPLLMALGNTDSTAADAVLEDRIASLNAAIPELYAAHANDYQKLLAAATSIDTPDVSLNEDLRWAELSIEQLRAHPQPTSGGVAQTALVAGYYSSGDSARPGFGWFFGRDSLYTIYAINRYGDFALTRDELDFLISHQRADGKMPHEYSQTAAALTPPYDWDSLPYLYAAADSTPLFLTTLWDYIRTSGDVGFVSSNKDAIYRAWQFETTHDSDGDGIYDNANGTGWVESWPSGMPHQEIYLALLDQQASAAMQQLAIILGDSIQAASAGRRATHLDALIESEYLDPTQHRYAFSRNADGTLDHTNTIYPAIAWWNTEPSVPGDFSLPLADPQASLTRWASHDFSTDWGLRDLAESDPIYDPISYHQGSVWPLFTGWASIAEYRSGRSLSGYQHLMQTADLTTAQDLGAVTELLSGAYFQPFGRSTSHQLWSSAMVITPLLRGLFGLDIDGVHSILGTTPQLPAQWDHAAIHNLHIGQSTCDITYRKQGSALVITLKTLTGPSIQLRGTKSDTLNLPLSAIEVGVPHALPFPGSRTTQLKVLSQQQAVRAVTLQLEAEGGSSWRLPLRRNASGLEPRVQGATIEGENLLVTFPPGSGYRSQTVHITW